MFKKFLEKNLTKAGASMFKKATKRPKKGRKRRKIAKKKAGVLGKQMDVFESLKIMNFEKDDEITEENLSERYWDYMERNDESRGGSAYLRAKIENAKDSLMTDFGYTLIQKVDPEEEGEEKEGEEKEEKEEKEKDGETK